MSNNLEAIERLKARADPPGCHTSGDSEMAAMLAEVDLLALIQADTGEQGRKSAEQQEREKKRRQKRRRSRRQKQRMLDDKHAQSAKKEMRRRIDYE